MSENVTGAVLRDVWATAKASLAQNVRSWLGSWPMSEFPRVFGAGPTSTGIPVDEYAALNYSAVWAAVSILSADIASLPLILYKRTANDGKERFTDSKLYELLHDAPNPEMTSMVFREALQAHVMTWGNAYAEIQRDDLGRPAALWPITPDRVTPFRDEQTFQLRYRVTNTRGAQSILLPRDVLHVPGLGFDGIMGYSVIQKARESISLGLATERFGASFFGNGSTFGGVLSHPQNLTTEVKQGIRESIDAVHAGVDRAHKFVILGGGMTYAKLGIPPNDAQFLETRKFQVTEIARWFQIPPHKLSDLERATFTNIEQQDIEYYKSGLRRWLVRWEQEINRKLISPLERKQQFVKHNAEGFLRGDSAARSSFYSAMHNIGAYSINMILEAEDLNKIGPEGDVHYVAVNLQPADIAMEGPQPKLPPLPTTKELPPAEDQQARSETPASEIRALLGDIATNTAALQTSLTAERDARSEAERTEHQQAITRLEQERDHLQRLFDEYREHHAADAATLQSHIDAARDDVDSERRAREAAEAAQRAADVTREAALAETAQTRDSAVRHAEEAAQARAAAEASLTEQAAAATAEAQAATERARQAEAEALTAKTAAEQAAALQADADAKRVAAEQRASEEATRLASVETTLRTAVDEARCVADRAATEAAAAHALAEQAATQRADADAKREAAEQAERAAAAALTTQQQAETERLTGMLAAHRALIVDAVQRVLAPEVDRARKHQATPEKLRAWIDTFYVVHEEKALETLRPAVRAHLAWKRSAEDVDAVTRALVQAHIAESQRQLRAVVDGEPEEMHADLDRLLTRWEQERPNALADHVLREEIDYVRDHR